MSRIVMTSDELVEKLVTLANADSKYSNKYPYNLLYLNKGGVWSADCVNLLKALFNGRDITDKKVGNYQHDLSNTGDCTELGLIGQCSEVSADFKKLGDVPKVLYMKGHIGCFLGKNMKVNDHIVNVVECTTNYGGGIVYSYVDENGCRYSWKNGIKSSLKWESHGKPGKWISYPVIKKEVCPFPVPERTLKKGYTGKDVSWVQWHLVKLGYMSSKLPSGASSIDGSYGTITTESVIKFQTKYTECGTDGKPDGKCGARTRSKLSDLYSSNK